MQQTEPWRVPRRAASVEPARVRVILYYVGPDIGAQCRAGTEGAEIELVEVKHLQAACATLKAGPATLLVVSTAVKWWDRHVVEEHAARAGVPTKWVPAEDLSDVGQDILDWALEAVKPQRPSTAPPPTRAPRALGRR